MEVNVRKLEGPWDLGYALDKHTISSTYIGDNEWGHPTFDTKRSEVGEALYQLKYRGDLSNADVIATELAKRLGGHFGNKIVVVPMPPSLQRHVQPVPLIARRYAQIVGAEYREDLLIKQGHTSQMKNIQSQSDRIAALEAAISVADVLSSDKHDILIIDDLYDSGSSLTVATQSLRAYAHVQKIFVATATSKR